mgnify:CR=1 FL=1
MDDKLVRVEIIFNLETGEIVVNGVPENMVIFLGMLETAKQAVLKGLRPRQEQSRIMMPIIMPSTGRKN